MGEPYFHELRVRYGECDPQGIVFNANYLLYFDVAFTELWRDAIGPWQKMNDAGFDAVVGSAALVFRSPARFDDVLGIELRVEELGRSSINTSLRISRGGELCVEGALRHVVVSIDDYRPATMPDWMRSGLERYAA